MHVASMSPLPLVKTFAPERALLFFKWKWSKAELYVDIEADGPIPVLAKTGRESVTSLKFSDEKILRRGIDATILLDK